MRGLKASRILKAHQTLARRPFATKVPPVPQLPPKKMEGVGEDPRPQWVYTGTRLVSFAIIPAVGLYAVFLYDFGEQEHVFKPIRRWVADGVNAFFTLSPTEKKLLHQEREAHAEARSSSQTV